MTCFGNELMFYLKYMNEMDELCSDEESYIRNKYIVDHPNASELDEMVERINEAAEEQALVFFEKSFCELSKAIKPNCQLKKRKSRSYTITHQFLDICWIYPKAGENHNRCSVGTQFAKIKSSVYLISWLWAGDSKQATNSIYHILNVDDKIISLQRQYDKSHKGAFVSAAKIEFDGSASCAESLLKKSMEPFMDIKQEDYDKIFKVALG